MVHDPDTTFLMIVNGDNAYNPSLDGYIPLIALDLWEHAYYIDYGPEKRRYIESFWNFLNWNFIEAIAQELIFGY